VLADEPSRPDFPVVVPEPAPEPVAPPPPVEEEKPCGFHWGVGLGAGYRPDYEGSNDYKPFPIGFVRLWLDDGRDIELRGAESSGSASGSRATVPDSDFEFGRSRITEFLATRSTAAVDRLDSPRRGVGGRRLRCLHTRALAHRRHLRVRRVRKHGGHLVELAGGGRSN
jgi:hypothetical protein